MTIDNDNFLKLWPLPIPEIVVVTGDYGTGKSTFALNTGAHPSRIVTIDFEKSQKSDAAQIPDMRYVDVQAEMLVKHTQGYKPIDLYQWIVTFMDTQVKANQYDVIILDNASPLEDAIADYVASNPGLFGKTAQQYQKMSGLMWGDVKNHYGQLLTRWVSKAQMIVIIVHLRDKYVNNQVVKDPVTGKPLQEPKGKETLEQLSSLFVWLDYGNGRIPSARVVKDRISKKVWIDDPANLPPEVPGEIIAELQGEPGFAIIPVLPPRLPKCNWATIREYMRHPAYLRPLKADEQLSKKEMNDDERLLVKAHIAENEAVVAQLKAEERAASATVRGAVQREQARQPQRPPAQSSTPAKPATPTPAANAVQAEPISAEELQYFGNPPSAKTPTTGAQPTNGNGHAQAAKATEPIDPVAELTWQPHGPNVAPERFNKDSWLLFLQSNHCTSEHVQRALGTPSVSEWLKADASRSPDYAAVKVLAVVKSAKQLVGEWRSAANEALAMKLNISPLPQNPTNEAIINCLRLIQTDLITAKENAHVRA